MKRINLVAMALVAIVAVGPATALDFGLDITEKTSLSGAGDEVALYQKNQAIAWLSLPVGAYSSLYASALYQFTGDFELSPNASAAIVPYAFTLGRFELEGFKSLDSGSSLKWSVGRVPFQDYSGRIVNSLLDGAKAELALGTTLLSASAGYSGLIFKDDASMLIDTDDDNINSDDGLVFAPKRLVLSMGARFVELLALHDFGVDGWAQFDLDSGGSAVTHTQYLEPYIEGRVGRTLRWRFWSALELGQDPDFFYALASGARLRMTLPETYGLRLTGALSWAGGDYDGTGAMAAFKPVTSSSLSTIGTTLFSDALSASVDAQVSPARGLAVGSNCAADFSADGYLGFEISGRAAYRPVNDFSATFTGGAFIPSAGDLQWLLMVTAEVKL
ncbi:MAG: hypothetical protein CVV47_08640 [Spirochaetae bacterium HGW-Spirochaetae-3]|nr:MAG: hypothetical protein CVV47_08640 [Spirochaetae bacterium HGW-Spirochaetae-3]